jgi:hypothetical protein
MWGVCPEAGGDNQPLHFYQGEYLSRSQIIMDQMRMQTEIRNDRFRTKETFLRQIGIE